jgi:replicative DNA helicase
MTAQQQPNPNGRTADVPLDKMIPHSVEAEEAVLGSVLINPDALYDVASFLRPDDFFIVKHAWVWEAMIRLHNREEEIDYITVVEELKARGQLEEIGGASYITYLLNNTPGSYYAETYGRIVQRSAIRRRILSAASEIAQLAHEESQDIESVIERAETAIFEATKDKRSESVKRVGLILEAVKAEVDRAMTGENLGVPSGFHGLDGMLHGFRKGRVYTVAGRPGMGKTSWLLTVALHIVKILKLPVLFISLEMTEEEVVQRIAAIESGISITKMDDGTMTPNEYATFTEGCNRVETYPLYIDCSPTLTPADIMVKARRLMMEDGLALVMIDYLGLMEVENAERDNREQQVSKMSRGTKRMARALGIPVLQAAQLNRELEKRQDKRPQLSDLRDSGSIEQDSDVVLFIYRDEYYNENTERPNQADVIIAKQRQGPTGVDTLYFRKELTQFANLRTTNVDLAGF